MTLIEFVKSKLFFKNLGLMAIIFLVILIIAFVLLNLYTRHGAEYIMPEIEGTYINDVGDVEGMEHFEVVVIDSLFTPGEKPGKIVSQDPKAGSKIKKGRKVYVVITSSTGEPIPMPNCKDLSVRSAVDQLTNAGLRVGKFIFNVGDFNNVVVGQRHNGKPINEGEQIQRGEEIDLVVEMNSDVYTTTIPNIIGLTEPEAEKKLWESALNVGKKTYEGNKDIIHSRVVSFSPNSSSVTKGTTISINFVNDTKPNYKERVKSFKVIQPPVVQEESPTNEVNSDDVDDGNEIE
jgi:beta-lactam-binding protein with PASTA domain